MNTYDKFRDNLNNFSTNTFINNDKYYLQVQEYSESIHNNIRCVSNFFFLNESQPTTINNIEFLIKFSYHLEISTWIFQ